MTPKVLIFEAVVPELGEAEAEAEAVAVAVLTGMELTPVIVKFASEHIPR